MINKNTMKLISIILLLLVIIGLSLYLYFKTKDTFTTQNTASVDIIYTVEVDVSNTINSYKFKDSINNYLKTNESILNPTLTLEDGKTYIFNNTANNSNHPFSLKDKDANSVGIDNNGNIKLRATSSESPYTYVCDNHSTVMKGTMNVISASTTSTTTPTTTPPAIPTVTPTVTTTPTSTPTTTPPAIPTVTPTVTTTPTSTPTSTPTARPTVTPRATQPPIVEIPTEPVITFPEHMTKEQYNRIIGLIGAGSDFKQKLKTITTNFSDFLNTIRNYNHNEDDATVEAFVDTITLNSDTFPELKSYAEIYNKNVALLDDPNELKKKTFDAYLHMQNKKIEKMRAELNILQTNISLNKKEIPAIKSFKSMNNSQSFNIELYNEVNPNNSTEYPNYLIYGNNGCLEYNKQNGIESSTWNFKSCDANNKKQQFVSTKIDNIDTYNRFINSETNGDRILKDNTSTLFGFNVINPIDTKDQCLQLNKDGLSVMPCSLDFSQRFRESYSTVIP